MRLPSNWEAIQSLMLILRVLAPRKNKYGIFVCLQFKTSSREKGNFWTGSFVKFILFSPLQSNQVQRTLKI